MTTDDRCFIGVDEVGMGSIAGPLVLAAVSLPTTHGIVGIRDSKKIAHTKVYRLACLIVQKALISLVQFMPNEAIDYLGIREAHRRASQKLIRRAVSRLGGNAHNILVQIDGTWTPGVVGVPYVTIAQGDDHYEQIGAASIVAKATRDYYMMRLAQTYPFYGFGSNKGYPTAQHKEGLRQHGPCAAHRRSYNPKLD